MLNSKHPLRMITVGAVALSFLLSWSVPVLAAPEAAPAEASGTLPTQVKYVEALTGLNVRSGPGYNYRVIGALRSGEIVPVLAVSADRRWWKIDCYWSSACWLIARSDLTRPVPGPYAGPIPYEETDVDYIRALGDVNIRSGPSTNYPVTGVLHRGETIGVLGVSLDRSWWRITCSIDPAVNCFVSAKAHLTQPIRQ